MTHILVTWGYLALFGVTFLSSMGIPAGSEVATGYAGALASGQLTTAHGHHLSLPVVILVAVVGEVVGSTAGYLIGRFGGRPLVDRVGKYVLVTHRDLDRAESWFARRGEAFVLFGRFIPLLRSFVSLAAGLGEMAFGKFLAFTVLGCAVWCAALSSIGYSLGASWHAVIKDFSDAGYVLAALFVVALVVVIAHRVRVLRAEHRGDQPLGRHARVSTPRQAAERRGALPADPTPRGSTGARLIASSRTTPPRPQPTARTVSTVHPAPGDPPVGPSRSPYEDR